MKNYNSIIIGSGLGGLIAGATLALWGKKVIVLEQHYIAGGCATAFKRKDYLMEVGLHEIDGLNETDPKRFFGLINRLYAEMRRLPRNKWLNILLYPLMPFLIPTIIKTSTMNTGDWLDANIKDEALKNVLTANLGYYTDKCLQVSL